MATRRDQLKSQDLIKNEPLECINCHSYMTLEKRLKNGKGRHGPHRKRRFVCEECGHSELIHAEGNKDLGIYKKQERELKQDMKAQLFDYDGHKKKQLT